MAATTTLLGLVTPTQGTLTGTWGDTVNYGISDYLDIAIAGTLSFAGDGAITLANTTGSSSGNSIGATTAQYAIIKVTGTLTTAKIITGPSYSKTYLVVNAATGSTVTFKASGQTGVSIAVGETALVYYNGTDYVKVVGTATAGAAGGSTTQVQYNNAGVLAGITGATTNGTALTLVAPVLGTPASGTVTNLTGTASININGTVGATTATTGAFTTLTTSSTVTVNGGTANGVAYLNGSKVLTTGSALTFDGTTATTPRLAFGGTTLPSAGTATIFGRSSDNNLYLQSGSGNDINFLDGSQNTMLSLAPATLTFQISNVNKLTLNSTGLQVTNTLSGGTSGTAYSFSGSAPATSLTLASDGRLTVGTNLLGGEGLALNGNGDSGDGPSMVIKVAGVSKYRIGRTAGIIGNSSNELCIQAVTGLGMNFYVNGSTQAAVIDSSGNVGIGTSSPAYKLDVSAGSGFGIRLKSTGAYGNFIADNTGTTGGGSYAAYQNGVQITIFGVEGSILGNTGTNTAIFNDVVGGGIKLYTNASGTPKATLDSSGNLLVGVATANANGGLLQLKSGITFPATAVAATDANTLDDYEEGTWTPTQGAGVTVVGTFGSSGTYTKIGNVVVLRGEVTGTTSIAVTGNTVLFGGLPFTSIVAYSTGSATSGNMNTSGSILVTSTTAFSTAFAATNAIYFTVTYFV